MATEPITKAARTRSVRFTAACLLGALLAACTPGGTSIDEGTLRYVKRTTFSEQATADANLVAAGLKQPVLEFTVEDTPPSTFVNYVVPDARAGDFTAAIGLPPGFSLAKVRILETDPVSRYWLSLNVYRVSGITTGLRAEWSTYVDDGSGVPRFMIIRARASEGSVDPIGPLAPAEPFSHSIDAGGTIRTAMNRTEVEQFGTVLTADNLFTSTIDMPAPTDRNYVLPTREWVAANDFIYWRNGVNDRIFHNSTSHSARLVSVDVGDVTLDDDTEWMQFVDPVPGHVLVYLDKLQFMIGPWWNITEPDGRVDPATRSTLLDLKKTMYGGLSSLNALSVLTGGAEPVFQSTVEESPPSVRWHWRIPAGKLAAFATAAHLPPGLTLEPIRLEENSGETAYWITMNAYRTSGSAAGVHTDWTTYVNDGTRARTYVLEARSNAPAIDPVDLRTLPYPLAHTLVGTAVTTTVGSGPTTFSSSFTLPPLGTAATTLASRQWVGAADLRYWRNGVADRVFYDSSVFDPKLSVDPASVSVTVGGPWAEFAGGSPDRVWVDSAALDVVTNPWWNLR